MKDRGFILSYLSPRGSKRALQRSARSFAGFHPRDIVKSVMKNRSRTYGKIKEALPLEGGGKRVGVKGLTGIARRLRKYSTETERHL
jgi:hypothetical protein